MQFSEDMKKQMAAQVPLVASSLLTTVYSYLAWRKPMDYDDKTFAEAYETVVKQWGVIMQQLHKDVFSQGDKKT